MEASALQTALAHGKDSGLQHRANSINIDTLVSELANGIGGRLVIGLIGDSLIASLGRQDMGWLNQLISNSASQHASPIRNPTSHHALAETGLAIAAGCDCQRLCSRHTGYQPF